MPKKLVNFVLLILLNIFNRFCSVTLIMRSELYSSVTKIKGFKIDAHTAVEM